MVSPQILPTWLDTGLSNTTIDLLKEKGFSAPTSIQSLAIPMALQGHDIIASSQTGTGKTASFVLPMIERLIGRQGTFGLILAPTREIAQQIQATLELFGAPYKIRSAALIGGVDIKIDQQVLQTYPQVLVATPGRLCDHLDRGNLWLDFLEMVVLDEADRMLDMGFSDQLARIMSEVPKKRQTLLFSATISPEVSQLAKKTLTQPKILTIGKAQSRAADIQQRVLWMQEESKNHELRKLLREEKGSIIVFTRSKDSANRVWRALHSSGVYDATYIHSDRLQAHREQALADFKEGKFRILIATEIAGRGIHVDQIAHVVNYDLPMEPENYVHRIGRTGRAGSSGKATTFATRRDVAMIRLIEELIGEALPMEYTRSFEQPNTAQSQPEGQGEPRKPHRPQTQTPGRQHSQRRHKSKNSGT